MNVRSLALYGLCASTVAVIVASSSAKTSTPQDAAPRKSLEDQHAKYWRWTEDENQEKILSIVTSDFTFKMSNGMTMDRKTLESVAKMPKTKSNGIRKQTVKTESVKVKGKNGKIVCKVHYESKYSLSNGSKHATISDAMFLEEWVLQDNTWKLKHVDTIKETLTIDGRRIDSLSKK
jgi:hypothetical protein